jgi:hypothetical protein
MRSRPATFESCLEKTEGYHERAPVANRAILTITPLRRAQLVDVQPDDLLPRPSAR